ncbi:MAG: hypothetical protein QXY92_05050, partial [Archaeoglobaceae archaeon]
VLNEIRKQDETSWIWNKAKLELGYLSRAVERNLAEFNVEGKGNALVMDAVTVCAVPLNPMVELRLECRQNTLPPNWLAILSCCGVFYGAVISCAGICGASLGLLCAGCILTGIGGTAGTCWSVCSAMDLCGYSLVGLVKIGCWRLW